MDLSGMNVLEGCNLTAINGIRIGNTNRKVTNSIFAQDWIVLSENPIF
jgi:hypothetical protein